MGTLAYLLGVMLGEGGVYGESYTVFCRDRNREFVDSIAGLVESLFRVKPKVRRASPNCWMASTNRKDLHRFFVELGYPKGRKLTTLRIPRAFAGDRESRLEVLRGLFDAEGYCGAELQKHGEKLCVCPYVGIDMIARSLLEEVQEILRELGMESSLSVKRPRARGRNPQLSLVLKGEERVRKFRELVGFRHPERREELERLLEGGSSETIR